MRPALVVLLGLAGCLGIPIHAKAKKKVLPPQVTALNPEWVDIPADEETVLRGIYVRRPGPPVLLLYGSGQGIAGVWELIVMLHDAGYDVLCADYRGTGYSSGRWWTSRYLDDDARVLWEWLAAREKRPAGVVGVSIGSIAASSLLDHPEPPAAVVLDRPVDPRNVIPSFVASELGPVSAVISRLVVRPKCDVDFRKNLAGATVPTRVVLPQHDLFCPPRRARALVAKRSDAVEVVTSPGAHYSSHLVVPEQWRGRVLDFLDAHLRPGQPALGGRRVPEGPAEVLDWRVEGNRLHLRLDRAPGTHVTVLLMGYRKNALVRFPAMTAECSVELPGRKLRRVGPLFKPRVLPDEFLKPIRTRWLYGGP